MKVTYDRESTTDPSVWEAELDNSQEEQEEIAEQICEALLENGEIRLDQFNVTLTHVERSNCSYNDQNDESFCDEHEVKFSFNVSPIDYMGLVIQMALEQAKVDEMSYLLYLEKDLIEVGYDTKELTQLTKRIEPFRVAWKREL